MDLAVTVPLAFLYGRAEAVAVELMRVSPQTAYSLIFMEGLLCLGIAFVGLQAWKAAHWASLPPEGACVADRLTARVLLSGVGCLLLGLLLVLLALVWSGWLFVEYVVWTSPRVAAELRGAEFSWGPIAAERHRDFAGRVVSFGASLFALGCLGWIGFWSWRGAIALRARE